MLLALALALQAAPPAAAPDQWHWVSRWNPGKCLLIRTQGDPATAWLSIETVPGSSSFTVSTRPYVEARQTTVHRNASVTLSPSAARSNAVSVVQRQVHGTIAYDLSFNDGFTLESLASANSLRVDVEGRDSFEIGLGHVASAVNSMRRCIDQQLQTWGIDPAALAALRQRPRPTNANGVVDYIDWTRFLSSAPRRQHGDAIVMRLDIDSAGRVTHCQAVVTTGSRALDERTCQTLTQRAQFEPALDASGVPTSAPAIVSISWGLGSGRP